MDDVVVGSRVFCCSCIFVSLRACYPVPISLVWGADTAVHTWVGVEFRVVGQHVAVNIKNPSRSWVHNRGLQQKSTFLLWTGVLQAGLGCIRGVVLGHVARTKMLGLPEQFGAARLLEDIVEWFFWGILCLSFGAWSTLCLAAVRPRFVAKLSERGFLSARIEWWMIRRISGRNLENGAAVLVGGGLVAAEILGGGIVVEAR